MTAEKQGFSVALADNVQVTVGARQRVDLTLQVGQLTERVEVTAGQQPRSRPTRSQRGQVITGEQTRALPLNGREYSSLALLTTGVRLSALNTGGGTPREGSFNVNGLRSTFNNFLIDGVDNNAYGTSNQGFSNQVMQPSPDAVAEFKVVTNNMSAEYGRSAGATINVAYASGTNRFSGSAWEFMRDTALNATGFFKPASGEKPPLERDQFGGVLGGPIVRNRAFFFADYEGFRQTRPGRRDHRRSRPRRSARASSACRCANPLTGETYPAGTPMPMTAFARKVLSDLPAPDQRRHDQQLRRSCSSSTNDTDKFGGKVDVTLSPTLSRVRPLRLSRRRHLRSADDSAAVGRRRQRPDLRRRTSSSRSERPGRRRPRRCSRCASAGPTTHGGKNPPALGTTVRARGVRHHRPADDPRVAGGLPTQIITGFTDLGRQATNPQWQYPDGVQPEGQLHADASAGIR